MSEDGWTPLPFGLAPPFCRGELSTDPSSLIDLAWVPCPVFDGCRRLPPDRERQRAFDDHGLYRDGEGRFTMVFERHDDRKRRRVTVLATTERVLAAWREDPPFGTLCGFDRPDFYENRVVVALALRTLDENLDDPVLGLDPATGVHDLITTWPASIGVLWAGPTVVAVLDVSGAVVAFRDGKAYRLGGAGSEFDAYPVSLTLVGDTLYWQDVNRGRRAIRSTIEDGSEVLVPAPGDGRELFQFQADPEWMAWQVFRAESDEEVEVWASPYVEDPRDLSPRKVAVIPRHGLAKLGGGHYVVSSLPVMVVHLASGQVRQLDPRLLEPAQLQVPAPLFVSPTEVAFSIREAPLTANVWRVPIAELPLREP